MPGLKVKTSDSYAADKKKLLARLSRIEGQARGLAKMVDADRYCIDILQQIASLRAAADAVALILLRDHLDGCVREAVQDGAGSAKIDEVVEAVRRYSRS
jgi:DNA-binding FrmR family transcriptional regulator